MKKLYMLPLFLLLLLIPITVYGQGAGTAASIYSTTFANLGSPSNGSVRYCTNCNANTSPCTSGGTGAFANRVNGAWSCETAAADAGGTVTSIATTTPITGGTITTTGTIACATCTTNAAALTLNQLVFGAGSQATAVGDLTGDVTTSGGKATTIAANAVTLAKLATQATNTVLGNATSGTAVPTALTVGTCSTAGSALIWTTNTGFGCNTSITAATVAGFTAGAGVLTGPASAGVAVTLGNNETITGIKTLSPTARSSGSAAYLTVNTPADTGLSTATESIGVNFVTATRTWVDGTVALQRERFFAGPTYNKTTTSATFTDVFNAYFTPPVAGTGVTFTRGHTLGIVDSTSAASSITGGFVVATTLGTTATSVGIGGGNINAGGTGTFGGTLSVTGHTTFEGVTSTGATGTGKLVYDTSPTFVTQITSPKVANTAGVAIQGTNTNDDAATGYVGELITSSVASGSAVSLSTGTAADVTSITLTAGDWDVWGDIQFLSAATTTITSGSASISTTSATGDFTAGYFGNFNYPSGTVLGVSNTTAKAGVRRMTVSSNTTVYLVAFQTFGTSTLKGWGFLGARRRR